MFAAIDQIMKRHASLPYVSMLVLLVCITALDYFTGAEYSSFTFYLLPIAIAAWYTNKNITTAMVLISAVCWLVCQQLTGKEYQSLLAPYWNVMLRLITFALVANLILTVRNSLDALTAIAMRDGLTQLNNARAFRSKYDIVRALAVRRRSPLAVAVIDLDGFKQVNDSKGHAVGDDVLRKFAWLLNDASRSSDIVARMGGDEFMVILADASEASARAYDARVRKAFDASGLKEAYGIDFSMGVVSYAVPPQDIARATQAADALMYTAKHDGKAHTAFEHVENLATA